MTPSVWFCNTEARLLYDLPSLLQFHPLCGHRMSPSNKHLRRSRRYPRTVRQARLLDDLHLPHRSLRLVALRMLQLNQLRLGMHRQSLTLNRHTTHSGPLRAILDNLRPRRRTTVTANKATQSSMRRTGCLRHYRSTLQAILPQRGWTNGSDMWRA
jgi:hypothetical protein